MTEHDHDQTGGSETRLTDYLFGELNADEALTLEDELAVNADLREQLAELRRTFALLKADAPAADGTLAPERRAALLYQADTAAAPRARVLSFPVWARAAAAVVIVAGIAAVWQQAGRPGTGARVEDSARLDAMHSLGYVMNESERLSAGVPGSEARAPEGAASRLGGSEPAAAGGLDKGIYRGPGDSLPPPASELQLSPERLRALSALGYSGGGGGSAAVVQSVDGRESVLPLLELSHEVHTIQPDPAADAFAGLQFRVPGTPATPAAPGAGGGRKAEPSATAEPRFERERLADAPEGLGQDRGAVAGFYAEDFDLEEEVAALGFGLDDGYGQRHHGEELLLHLRRHGNESPRDMFYRYYGDNAVVRTADDPFSTFATDVDTASWALLRSYLVQGHLAPKAAVRTEECVNAFEQELAAPAEEDFALHLEAAPTPFAPDGHLLLRVGIKAREVSRAARKPLNLVFVVDKSGSMASQNRMQLVKDSLELLVDQIRDDDTIGIVAFDSNGHEVLAPTAGAERWRIREALRGLSTGGSTNAAEGLFLGYAMAERAFRKEAVNRVVLASDGVANTGETDQSQILAKVRSSAEREIDLTSIGVGMGNHNDVFLERLANDGNGSCHYVDSMEEAKRVLVDGFTGAMQVVAREARVQVEFSSGTVREWRQLGYENRVMKHEDFRNDSVDAGEIGAGHEMVALYELKPQDLIDGPDTVATIRLRWKPDGARDFVEVERTFGLGDARSRWELASSRFRLAGTVAQFAEFMRRSVHARGDAYADLQEHSQDLARELKRDPMVAEFRDLVERAAHLAQRLWPEDELALLIDQARRLRLAECELESLSQRSEKAEELLKEVRLQNQALERRLEELLQPR